MLLTLFVLAAATLAAEPKVSFNRDVRPIFSDKCYYCHGTDPNHRKADRRLDTRDGALSVKDGVKAIVPGKPDESDAITRIFSTDSDEQMPPPKSNKTLTAAEKETLRRWVAEGAKYEPHWAFVAPRRGDIPVAPRAEGTPAVADRNVAAPCAHAIDAFVAKKLAEKNLTFSPQAEKGALLRRVTLDLTGLPPTLAELDALEKDASADAFEGAVDRLLTSPRFGERMAVDWLDAARYADTNGYQGDAYRMNWPWRDWVVQAFNDNMPFDQFTIEQLAGDLLPLPSGGTRAGEAGTQEPRRKTFMASWLPASRESQLVATAFNRNHMLNAEGGTIPEENRTKNVFDRVETTSGVFLGLTMQCCQCHDHKFDPLKQSDYYSMFALFNQLSEPGGVDRRFGKKDYSDDYDKLYSIESPFIALDTPELSAKFAAARAAKMSAEAALEAKSAEFEPPFIAWILEMRANTDLINERVTEDGLRRAVTTIPLDKPNDGRRRSLREVFLKSQPQWAGLLVPIAAAQREEDAVQSSIPLVMVMRDDKPRETHILNRGNYETPGEKVPPNVPDFLPPLPAGAKADRLALAKWLVAPEQPLMPRVVVNRLWQMFFGRGLVKTPDDFGMQGALPSHPELLDWLAVEFRESGWDVKHMVKLIVTSRTYRQAAVMTPALLAKDPDNALLARGPRFRLDSRFLRDQALALAGLLVEKRGGFPVMPYQPPGIWEDISFGKNRYFQGTGEDLHRRSLYTFWRRSVAPANFFDTPARQVCVVKPFRTNTPLQALTTLNDTTYVEAARVWAEHLAALPDDEARLRQLLSAATARAPEPRELASLKATLAKSRMHFTEHKADAEKLIANGEAPHAAALDPTEHAAWTTICLLVLNLDETLNR